MIYELRTYTFHPGKMPEYLKLAEEVGTKVRGDRYGKREGSWVAEIGVLNQIWHLWSYPSLDERQRLRGELAQNRDWTEGFVARIRGLLARQEIRFMDAVRPPKAPPEPGNIYELRIYRAHTGRAREWAKLIGDAMPTREKYSPNLGLWVSEAPDPNTIVHLWAYKDLNARMAARGAAAQDPEWQAFLGRSGPLLVEMQSVIMLPTGFSPLR